MSESRVQHLFMPYEGNMPGPSNIIQESPSATPPSSDPSDLLRLIAEANVHGYVSGASPKTSLERLLGSPSSMDTDNYSQGIDVSAFGMSGDFQQYNDYPGIAALRNSSKTLKCPKCNWHYKYQETLEIHMKDKHPDGDVKCVFCVDNLSHPKLARGESYSCGYKPYRCELCKYSTTTKGNLSIHMQSDKHLHAMQELPNNIASLNCAPSRSPITEGEKTFVCLVCGNFSGDSIHETIQHAEKDRSRPSSHDVSILGGVFRCHLCPYNTNLKANFQLHTRTDKHLQKLQTLNHLREGPHPSAALLRLNSVKSHFQVLCRPCQEILNSSCALRDHCDSSSHRTNLRQPLLVLSCRLCPYETQIKHEAIGHMTCHELATWPRDTIDFDALAMDEEAAYACASCGFTAKEVSQLEEHAKSHEAGEKCPICQTKTASVTTHLVQEHKVPESSLERVLQIHGIEQNGPSSSFSHRCSQCQMAFRSEASLHSHSLVHLFVQSQKCTHCTATFKNNELLKAHSDSEHPSACSDDSRCDLCCESFPGRNALMAHFNSVRHLHRAKKQLEQGSVDLSAQVLQALQNPSSPGERKPFRCNVCKIGYGQGATLDIHIRSVAHQSKMSKLAELVSTGEVDASKAPTEQPGQTSAGSIADLLAREEESSSTQQPNVLAMFNIMNMLMAGQNQQMNMPFGQQHTNNQANHSAAESPDEDDPMSSPRTSSHLIGMLRTFGVDRLANLCPELAMRLSMLGGIPDENIPSICQVDCSECGEMHPSIVALGIHSQDAHCCPVPEATVRSFCVRLLTASRQSDSVGGESPISRGDSRDDSEPPEKRPRSGPTPPEQPKPDLAQMAMLSMMGGFPFLPGSALGGFMHQNMQDLFNPLVQQQLQMGQSPAKRARTRISDDQLKILRQYFDINNSPTEAQIKEMSIKAGLPEKVIKHWFRNTLFKERQRDKDSPYNFSVPPQMSIDLDTYDKTGETKVVPLAAEVKREPVPPPVEVKKELPPPAMNLQAMMQQMQAAANPFQFMEHGMMHGQMNQLPSQSTPSGRRANRTRFTDHQLRTLQQFFDKQAYPKDDDLEVLSKKLQLSPRVIVVWFQNARQKARKIYENQPNHENSDRFVRTPGCNFQCKRCNLVFQRYYELIQHQQKTCYKDDGLAQANDNKGVEESLTEDEKAQLAQQTPAMVSETKPTDLLRLLGGGKSSTEALLKMCESANATSSSSPALTSFHKRCPFCALLFRSKLSMVEHVAMRHPQQMMMSVIDIDRLPEADDVPAIPMASLMDNRGDSMGALDLSSAAQDRESLSMSPFLGQSDCDDGGDPSEDSFAALLAPNQPGASRSPANNKRYRTHLTPVQVHVMKCVFFDYKTPSMSECESLGRDIGLHKRVVQVWFQNARAKERKSRASNGEPDEVFRSTATRCSHCNVEYSGRTTMQDHLFSPSHLAVLKSQSKNDPNCMETIDSGTDGRSSVKTPSLKPPKPVSQLGVLGMNGFPFSFMNGMMHTPGANLMLDQAMFGVPVALLQIPDAVKDQIKVDMACGQQFTRFTHDGATISDLREQLPSEDSAALTEEDMDVGWGCPTCANIFQAETQLKAHQRQFCAGTQTFTLIQTHYGCSCCKTKFGSQADFLQHCETRDHVSRRATVP